MAETAMIRREGPHPATGKRTPARNEDFFLEDELRALREYVRPLRRNRRIKLVISTVLELAIVFGFDLAPKVGGWIAGQGWVLRLLLIAVVLDIITTIPMLPFSWWTQLVYEKRAGHSTMTVPRWIKDQLLELALNAVIGAVVLIPVYLAIHRFGDWWWLVGGAIVVAVQLALAFIAPVVIMPRFNKFTPLPEGPIRTRIEEIAAQSGVQIEGVYLMDASKRTTRANAGVTGFGKTKRVIVNDTICDFPLEELSQVIAHELGHYRLNHVVKSFPLSALQLPLAFAFVQLVVSRTDVLSLAGVRDLGDPASYAVFGFLVGLPMTLTSLATKHQSRTYEREADLEALELLSDPTSFLGVWPRMVLNDKANLEPTPWERLQSTHPEVAERMQFALDWAAMNELPVTRPERRRVPSLVPGDEAPAAE